MLRRSRVTSLLTAVGIVTLVAACGSDTVGGPTTPSLTIRGSAGAPPAGTANLVPLRAFLSPGHLVKNEVLNFIGDPSAVKIGVYAFYLSQNEDCSAPVLVANNGTTPVVKDFAQNPVLFTGTPDAGTYKCVILRMSDVITFQSAVASTNCATHTDYTMDIYRAPDADFLDVNGSPIVATGTDVSPSDDKVYIFASINPAAVTARGMSPHQTLTLTGTLTVPGTGTFYWNGHNTVTDNAGSCGMQPPQLEFR
jgi:hypothetical protein